MDDETLQKVCVLKDAKDATCDEKSVQVVYSALKPLRGMQRLLSNRPLHAFQKIIHDQNFNGKSYYACDICELRNIFRNGLVGLRGVVLSNMKVSKNLFYDRDILLELEGNPCDIACKTKKPKVITTGGVAVILSASNPIENHLRSIIIQNHNSIDHIGKILQDFQLNIPYYQSDFIPSMQQKTYNRNKNHTIKLSDASSASSPGGYNAGPDSNSAKDRNNDIKHMIRYDPGKNSVYRVGDRVIYRKSGLGEVSPNGIIEHKTKDGIITVKWDDGEKSKINLTDPIQMSYIERYS